MSPRITTPLLVTILTIVAVVLSLLLFRSQEDAAGSLSNVPPAITLNDGPKQQQQPEPEQRLPEGILNNAERDHLRRTALEIAGGGTAVAIERADDRGARYEVDIVDGGLEIEVAFNKDLDPVPIRGD